MPEANITITEFLEERIAEDEAEAEKGWDHNGTSMFARDNYGCLLIKPSRVLAECAAKRDVVDSWTALAGTDLKGDPVRCGMYSALSDVIADLAVVYASHEDYREEWAL